MTAAETSSALDGTDPLAHALHYAGLGWRVAPARPGTKYPRLNAWQDAATTDEGLLVDWWTRWPDHGVCIVTGSASDVFGLDVDPKAGGDDTLASLQARYGRLPDTVTTLTGGGGTHFYFRWPELEPGKALSNSAGQLGPGLDIRADRGQLVAPPTVHPDTGARYEWEASSRPGEVEVAEAPDWLLDLIVTDETFAASTNRTSARPDADANVEPPPPESLSASERFDASPEGRRYALDRLLGLGWTICREDASGLYLTRPGKNPSQGHSASFGIAGPNVLYVFSGAPEVAPFEAEHGYSPSRILALLDHDGDLQAAEDALAAVGWGFPMIWSKDHPARAEYLAEVRAAAETTAARIDELVTEGAVDALDVFWADNQPEPPPIQYLVNNAVARGELTVIGAPRAIGKSWAVLDLARTVATGVGNLFGVYEMESRGPANVMILHGELGRSSSYARWHLTGDVPHVAEVYDRLPIRIERSRVSETYEGLTFSTESIRATPDRRLEPLLDRHNVDLLIVDPWASFYRGNENHNDEVEAAIEALTDIARRRNMAVVLVHHISAKTQHSKWAEPEDLWRGASRLADAVAVRITLLPHYSTTDADKAGLDRFDARRYIDVHVLNRLGPPIGIQHAVRDPFSWQAWTPEPIDVGGRPTALTDREVVNNIAAAGGRVDSLRQLADRLGASQTTIRRHVERLEAAGAVRIGEGPRGATAVELVDGGAP